VGKGTWMAGSDAPTVPVTAEFCSHWLANKKIVTAKAMTKTKSTISSSRSRRRRSKGRR
jgi:hypothetical protein